jgi:murein DD-endopeptidase MepM/ murein hydrolase activator NlpD
VFADGFDFPVGKPTGAGYQAKQDYGARDRNGKLHAGEDWNSVGAGNDDLGDAVYAAAAGRIIYAANAGRGWGNVIVIHHRLAGMEVTSLYGHLERILRVSGEVSRGEQIGTIGRGNQHSDGTFDYQDTAHLHFEIRTDVSIGVGLGASFNLNGWVDPTNFINSNRPSQVALPPTTSVYDGHWSAIATGTSVAGTPARVEISFDVSGSRITNFSFPWRVDTRPGTAQASYCGGDGGGGDLVISNDLFLLSAADAFYSVRISGAFSGPNAISGAAQFIRQSGASPWCESATITWSGSRR